MTSGTMVVVVGASVVVVVSTSSGTGGGVDASAAVANVTAAVAATITSAATRPNFARIGGMLVDTARHEAPASATVQSNGSLSTTSIVAIDPASSRSAVPARNESCDAAGSITTSRSTSAR